MLWIVEFSISYSEKKSYLILMKALVAIMYPKKERKMPKLHPYVKLLITLVASWIMLGVSITGVTYTNNPWWWVVLVISSLPTLYVVVVNILSSMERKDGS